MAHTNPTKAAGDEPVTTTARSEADRLREEIRRLRAELDEARANARATPNTRPVPHEPSFGLSEGERADLEQNGVTTSPWTGEKLTATEAGVKPANDDAKKADEHARSDDSRDGEK